MTGASLTRSTSASLRPLAIWTIGLALLGPTSAAAATEPDGSAAQVWIISTRCAPACGPTQVDDPHILYWTFGENRQWLPSDRAAFLASDRDAVPTIIFLHGNWVDAQDAVNDGWQIYYQLKQQSGRRPFRFVIWSWPSQRSDRRVLNDVRMKAASSDVQAYYLAGLVHQIRPDVPVALVGYSFGSRAITAALEMLAGGQVAGMALPKPAPAPRPRLRAVLMAAALDSDWLLPGHRDGDALSQVQHMLITRNLTDPVLRRYHWLYGRCPAQALGWAGPACPASLGPEQQKIEVVDVTCWVGKNHDFTLYAGADPASSRLGWYCFLAEPDPQPATSSNSLARPLSTRK